MNFVVSGLLCKFERHVSDSQVNVLCVCVCVCVCVCEQSSTLYLIKHFTIKTYGELRRSSSDVSNLGSIFSLGAGVAQSE
jgi:hypothetical protein